MEFTSVTRQGLQEAFALAHRCAENPEYPIMARAKFASIAKLIWTAHGEAGEPPAGAGDVLQAKFAARLNALLSLALSAVRLEAERDRGPTPAPAPICQHCEHGNHEVPLEHSEPCACACHPR
jgi:hypothetical protein